MSTPAKLGPSWLPLPSGTPFPLANLPIGIGRPPHEAELRAVVALGDHAVDLARLSAAGALDTVGAPAGCFAEVSLNRFLAGGPTVWRSLRACLAELLTDPRAEALVAPTLHERTSLTMALPVTVGDYVDFYSSLHHATNLGRLFRPGGEPLLPNWRHLPVGYHGRSGTLVPDGSVIPRPSGLRLVDGEPRPAFGPSGQLDIELEVGFVIGVGSERGEPIPTAAAGQHLYGLCLVNDWSARDIQAFEYQPLGPFLGKSFATSVSPWLVSLEALAPFRVPAPVQEPPVVAELQVEGPWGFDLDLEVWLQSAAMAERAMSPIRISRTGFADLYWTAPQQLAHITANGASTRTGDLFASGTVSGPEPGSEGSLIELTWRGERPLRLPDGTSRSFLADKDRVTLRGWAGHDPATRIGLGEVSGIIG